MYNPNQKTGKAKTVILFALILLLGVSTTVWGLFYLQQEDKNKVLQNEVSNLTALNNSLSSKKSTALAIDPSDISSQSNSLEQQIPELGVKYKITETNKDLVYSYDGTNSATFYSKPTLDKATAKPPIGCDAKTVSAIAKITKYGSNEAIVDEDASSKAEAIKDGAAKKVGEFYISLRTSDVACKSIEAETAYGMTENFNNNISAVRDILGSLESI